MGCVNSFPPLPVVARIRSDVETSVPPISIVESCEVDIFTTLQSCSPPSETRSSSLVTAGDVCSAYDAGRSVAVSLHAGLELGAVASPLHNNNPPPSSGHTPTATVGAARHLPFLYVAQLPLSCLRYFGETGYETPPISPTPLALSYSATDRRLRIATPHSQLGPSCPLSTLCLHFLSPAPVAPLMGNAAVHVALVTLSINNLAGSISPPPPQSSSAGSSPLRMYAGAFPADHSTSSG